MAMDGPVVQVRGEVTREVPPELARFAVTVTARGRDREATLTQLAERAAAVRVLLDGSEPAVARRETGDLWVRPQTKRSGERVVGWLGSVTTTVTVTDFTALGELMLRLADQDQVSVSGPWWELRPDSPTHREARHAAIRDALLRAREYAEALGARVTALIELADTGPADGPMFARAALARGGGAGGGPPELELDPQPQTVRAAVQARFTISDPVLD
ncbi:SIMPL domain-containing protein [Micromonospora sp. LAH09]|uniref:SIMPL domain-containing protein n=1 Tax=Micromonospora cabrerizensis TaxID=2911213 RepID=UPI001EE979BE|nr:SIMPL domain-containing protein [Micromonospora cabrerizensis]MCG5469046.1 SIMPL domain-containing protein [Micromonospora cabrerizensis]